MSLCRDFVCLGASQFDLPSAAVCCVNQMAVEENIVMAVQSTDSGAVCVPYGLNVTYNSTLVLGASPISKNSVAYFKVPSLRPLVLLIILPTR